MRFLADENLHPDLIAWMRSRGEDVLAVAEVCPGEPDEVVLRYATTEARVVVTDDKDFGELVVHRRFATAGVLLLRFHSSTIAARAARLDQVWDSVTGLLPGRFVVLSDRTIRARPIESMPSE